MTYSVTRQSDDVLPPMYNGVVVVSCNATTQVLDLTTFPYSTAVYVGNAGKSDKDQLNPIGKYIRITAQAGDVYFAMGSNATLLATINASNTSTINATTRAITVGGTECDYIPAGSWKDVLVHTTVPPDANGNIRPGVPTTMNPVGANTACRYLALVCLTGGTATARVYQSSP